MHAFLLVFVLAFKEERDTSYSLTVFLLLCGLSSIFFLPVPLVNMKLWCFVVILTFCYKDKLIKHSPGIHMPLKFLIETITTDGA